MTLYSLKPRFQALLRPAARRLHARAVTANQVTVGTAAASLLLGGGLALAAAAGELVWFLLLPGWLLLRMALNAIDGLLAREFGHASRLGACLNELADLLADAALYLPFALLPATGGALAVLVVVLANVAEMAAVVAAGNGSGRRNDGPMGKSDRALVFGALGLLLGCGVAPGPWLAWVLTIVAVLLLPTIGNRVWRGIAGEDRSRQP
ncbi:MAG TPA: CDP-alcohol phosphatidyltransferase family protein [Candidatus Accumulibacter phosphatis]|nr:MAG: Inner membrane protein YnbA [Candidatus Accumulibacter sp. SK-11]HAY29135.1 CDP-alcohol phosphatidyltransferase [Accumulibacter sp.]HRL77243.1 CDP-alcohol phosphatidyltransferase family protein [Candidatus Accumulibacter phosphatis]HCN66750.1 CDP-alcohol phosphatidyltransferase [Accumulibacter sp.]HCV12181.1 CDP-alcohol phosphatidyltransferase [Accumulibacter sp.]